MHDNTGKNIQSAHNAWKTWNLKMYLNNSQIVSLSQVTSLWINPVSELSDSYGLSYSVHHYSHTALFHW